tara:strand:+ start:680 stop:874 length:195 start_codon:yes stop_codon:yes gene_type:complete
LAKTKTQSPVVEQVINAYEAALKEKPSVSDDARERLLAVLLGAAAPTASRVEEALFPQVGESGE